MADHVGAEGLVAGFVGKLQRLAEVAAARRGVVHDAGQEAKQLRHLRAGRGQSLGNRSRRSASEQIPDHLPLRQRRPHSDAGAGDIVEAAGVGDAGFYDRGGLVVRP